MSVAVPLLLMLVTGSASAPTADAATSCRSLRAAGFSLKVQGTDCAHGRAVQRAYIDNPFPNSCGQGCTVRARGERWRCKPRVLRGSGYYVGADETIRGRVACHRLRDGAGARWQYSGGGD